MFAIFCAIKNRIKLLMCTFDEVFGFKSAELMKCLQGRSLTQFATKNIGCFVYELNRESDYTDKNNVLLFVQRFQKDVDNFQLFYRDEASRRALAEKIIQRYYLDNQPFFIGANDTKRVQQKIQAGKIDRNMFTNELKLAGILANSIKTESVIERKVMSDMGVRVILKGVRLSDGYLARILHGAV